MAGSVKAKKADRHATSDWMAMERERGISISTSVMQFEYGGYHLNLLDTPGHNDFSEDTYRTLAAADAAIMLIDSVKGVEPQTIKLFTVCRMRGIPIVTFVNKMDRDGREPLELLAEIEEVLGIPTSPVSWPVGAGKLFQGVYDLWGQKLLRFHKGEGGSTRIAPIPFTIDDPELRTNIGPRAYDELVESVELLEGAGNAFDQASFLAGEITPVFFGSALTNFGVEHFLDNFVELAPPPAARKTLDGTSIEPEHEKFSGFVFKIQANMDPRHRDRIAFVRICSGRFERGMEVINRRSNSPVCLAKPMQFFAQERTLIDEAFAGDILGLWDPGLLRIGDSLTTGLDIEFEGIPRFSPEHFVRVGIADPLKRKQLKKGLEELSQEGAVQVFYDRTRLERDPILGAVGVLQFEVTQHRLEAEYSVRVKFEHLPYQHARWVEGDFDPDAMERRSGTACFVDLESRPIVLFTSEWMMRRIIDDHPKLRFIAAMQPARSERS
jgi:peptide chain release factor 3